MTGNTSLRSHECQVVVTSLVIRMATGTVLINQAPLGAHSVPIMIAHLVTCLAADSMCAAGFAGLDPQQAHVQLGAA